MLTLPICGAKSILHLVLHFDIFNIFYAFPIFLYFLVSGVTVYVLLQPAFHLHQLPLHVQHGSFTALCATIKTYNNHHGPMVGRGSEYQVNGVENSTINHTLCFHTPLPFPLCTIFSLPCPLYTLQGTRY